MFGSFNLETCPSNTQADASAYVCSGRSMNTRLIYALLMVCFSWTAVAWSAEEGEAIERTIKEAAMAASLTVLSIAVPSSADQATAVHERQTISSA